MVGGGWVKSYPLARIARLVPSMRRLTHLSLVSSLFFLLSSFLFLLSSFYHLSSFFLLLSSLFFLRSSFFFLLPSFFLLRHVSLSRRARHVHARERRESRHSTCAAVSVKSVYWRPFFTLSSFVMSLRRCFRSSYLRGARRGTDVVFCVVGGEVVFEGSFAYFFGGFLFYLFVCLFLCLPVYVPYCLKR